MFDKDWNSLSSRENYKALKPEQKSLVQQKWFDQKTKDHKEFKSLAPEQQEKVRALTFGQEYRPDHWAGNQGPKLTLEPDAVEHSDQGFLGSTISAIGGGLADAVDTTGRMTRGLPWGEAAGQDQGGIGSGIIESMNKLKEAVPGLRRQEKATGFNKALYEGARSAVTSLAAGAPGAAAGAAIGSVVPGVGTGIGALIGGIIGYATSGATMFGVAEYDRAIEEGHRHNQLNPGAAVPLEDLEKMAMGSAIAEGGFEFVTDLIEGATFKLGTALTAPTKATLREGLIKLLGTNLKKTMGRVGTIVGTETGMEMATSATQAELRYSAGIGDQRAWDAAKEAFGPSLVASIIFAGVAEGGGYRARSNRIKALQNPTTDPMERLQVIDSIYEEIKAVDQDLAAVWAANAEEAVSRGESIPIDEDVAKLKLFRNEAEQNVVALQRILTDPGTTEQNRQDAAGRLEEAIRDLQEISRREESEIRRADRRHLTALEEEAALQAEEVARPGVSVSFDRANPGRPEQQAELEAVRSYNRDQIQQAMVSKAKTPRVASEVQRMVLEFPDHLFENDQASQAVAKSVSNLTALKNREAVLRETVRTKGVTPEVRQELGVIQRAISASQARISTLVERSAPDFEAQAQAERQRGYDQVGNEIDQLADQRSQALSARRQPMPPDADISPEQREEYEALRDREHGYSEIGEEMDRIKEARNQDRDFQRFREMYEGNEIEGVDAAEAYDRYRAFVGPAENISGINDSADTPPAPYTGLTEEEKQRFLDDADALANSDPNLMDPNYRRQLEERMRVTPSVSPFPAMGTNEDFTRYRGTDVGHGRGKNVGPMPVNQTAGTRQQAPGRPKAEAGVTQGEAGVTQGGSRVAPNRQSPNPVDQFREWRDMEEGIQAGRPDASAPDGRMEFPNPRTAPNRTGGNNAAFSQERRSGGNNAAFSKPNFDDMVAQAARWRGAAMNVDKELVSRGVSKGTRINHHRITTKGDLDAYLMRKFGIDAAEARSVSNALTARGIRPDQSAKIEDFADEPWVKALGSNQPENEPQKPSQVTGEPKKEAQAKPGNDWANAKDERGRVSELMNAQPGQVFKTSSGRDTTPYPKQKLETYHSTWLIENATREAESRGDKLNARIFQSTTRLKGGILTQADREIMTEYLFGEQPPVIKPALKDLTEKNPHMTDEQMAVFWDGNLTPSGRLDILKEVGINLPGRTLWRHISKAHKEKILAFHKEVTSGKRALESNAPEKQPWQIMPDEYWQAVQSGKLKTTTGDKSNRAITNNHRIIIMRAIKDGKPVPDEVLKAYPDLKTNPPTLPEDQRTLETPPGVAPRAEAETPDISPTQPAEAEPARSGEESTRADTEPNVGRGNPEDKLSLWVFDKLMSGERFDSKALFAAADQSYGGTQGQGVYTPKDAYDAMELGVNRYIALSGKFNPGADTAEEVAENLKALKRITNLLPTQTKRTQEQQEFQQFSTPPPLAYLVAWAANPNRNDTVLEPSAGIGGLAVFGQAAGAKVIVNELSPRRAGLLKLMRFDRVFQENAEQLNNVLPDDVRPTVIIMNPPFSATAGRLSKNSTMNGAKHIEQALARLEEGGRLVAIVGKGMGDNAYTFREWWPAIKAKYNVRANILVSGDEYSKYGTTFDNRVLIIDKTGPTVRGPMLMKADEYAALIPVLQEVRNDRQGIHRKNEADQRPSVEPGGPQVSSENLQGSDIGRPPIRIPSGKGVGVKGEGSATPRDNGISDRGGSPGRPRRNDRTPGPDGGVSPLAEEQANANEPRPPRSGKHSERDDREKLTVTIAEKPKGGEVEISDSLFDRYTPKATVRGAKPHPTPLDQSVAMADTELPDAKYSPSIPQEVIDNGILSNAQLEAIIYAGHAHSGFLPDGSRRGFFIGDGTGVGKGREIAGIIMDNWNKGNRKAIWVSKNAPLFKDAQRDVKAVWPEGADKLFILDSNSAPTGEKVKHGEGIMFVSYGTLASNFSNQIVENDPRTHNNLAARIGQIVDWVGPDYDGVIAFDESHMMANAISDPSGNSRNRREAAARALAGKFLAKALPKAKVVYVSATGATEVSNLAYADRLGLWGEGTPFRSTMDFVTKISAGGVAVMEQVARDMKSMGLYIARALSYDNVSHTTHTHTLTENQRATYDAIAEAWQVTLNNFNEALGLTEADGLKRGQAMSQFWGANQRFFNTIITSMQMPSVFKKIEKDLEDGHAVVLQLINTGQELQKRALAKLEEGQDLEEIDMSPMDELLRLVETAFPVYQYQTVEDENGNPRQELVLDSNGNPVVNREALAMKEDLQMRLASVNAPSGPLEFILDTFGHERVAEVTGRTFRIVRDKKTGKKIQQTWSTTKSEADARAFMDGKKDILVFSEAGGTGRSFHADRTAKNQKKRKHYLIQPGWRADVAVQGLGRTHRSNQAHPPEFVLVTTDLKGQKRFLSTIARRLEQLGALTSGERRTSSKGLFQAKDNLESVYAVQALDRFVDDLVAGSIQGLTVEEFQAQTGLTIQGEDGGIYYPKMQQFLNRLLSMRIDQQNLAFDAFAERMEAIIDFHEQNGTLDVGIETITGRQVTKKVDTVVFEDKEKSAKTRYVNVEIIRDNDRRVPVEKVPRTQTLYRNIRSGKIWAATRPMSSTDRNGNVTMVSALRSPSGNMQKVPYADMIDTDKWESLSRDLGERLWTEAYDREPETITEDIHLLSGSLLPIWDKIPGKSTIYRTQTSDGERILGRVIPEDSVSDILDNLGLKMEAKKVAPEEAFREVLENGSRIQLDSGIMLKRSMVAGEARVEIIPKEGGAAEFSRLESLGAFSEMIQWKRRAFLPTGRPEAFERLTERDPVVRIIKDKQGDGPQYSAAKRTRGRITVAEVQRAVGRGLTVKQAGEGRFLISGQDSVKPIELEVVDHIPVNEDAFRRAYHRDPTPEEMRRGAAGVYHKGKIQISVHGDQFTIDHEFTHALIEAGVLSFADIRAILKSAGVDPSKVKRSNVRDYEEQIAAHIEAVRMRSAEPKGLARAAIQKIIDLIDRLVNLVHRTARGVIRDIESGRIFGREAIDKQRTVVPAYEMASSKWFSQMEKFLSRKLANGTPEQIIGNLRAWAAKGEFKGEELEWSGLIPWLEAQTGKVKKDDVLSWLTENNVRLEEVVKQENLRYPVRMTGDRVEVFNSIEEAAEAIQAEHDWIDTESGYIEDYRDDDEPAILVKDHEGQVFFNAYYDKEDEIWKRDDYWDPYDSTFDDADEAYEAAEKELELHKDGYRDQVDDIRHIEPKEDHDSTKYDQYTLPGGENYKEMLLTLPDRTKMVPSNKYFKIKYKEPGGGGGVATVSQSKIDELRFNGFDVDVLGPEMKKDTSENYTSGHWDEPNVLTHIRFSEREQDGERILHVEEIQSDWHQDGRKSGYRAKPFTEKDFRIEEYTVETIPAKYAEWVSNPESVEQRVKFISEFNPNIKRTSQIFVVINNRTNSVAEWSWNGKKPNLENPIRYANEASADKGGIPDAPFKTSWPMLAFKRMVRYAAENGFDRIAWTAGKEQAKRYDLSKHIDTLLVVPVGDGTYNVSGDKDGDMAFSEIGVPESRLEAMIGKELAKKAVKDTSTGLSAEYSGIDLQIGGEGMHGFYDKILPAEVNKFFGKKAWGSPKVGTMDIEAGEVFEDGSEANPTMAPDVRERHDDQLRPKKVTVWTIPITPEMKSKAMREGMPLYNRAKTVSPRDDAKYMKAVEAGDMETARAMVLDAAMKAGVPILDDSAAQSYRVRRTAPPKKTVKAYKLFNTKKKSSGEIFPLFVGAKTPVPRGIWLDAIEGEEGKPSKTGRRKVKAKGQSLAYRPGWHAGDAPFASHIGAKDATGKVYARQDYEVWAEVEMAADVDYQSEADANGKKKDGSFSGALADIKHMPKDGMYRYKTNPNMTGKWIISGSMKVNRILSEEEANKILAKKGIDTMSWKSGPLILEKLGLNSDMAENQFKLLDPVTYDDAGNVIPLSRRFDPASTDPRYSFAGPRSEKWMATPESRKMQAPTGRRYEIDDSKAVLVEGLKHGTYSLGDILDHDALYEAYPALENLRVDVVAPGELGGVADATYSPVGKTITLRYGATRKESLIHEVQHAIQDIEGVDFTSAKVRAPMSPEVAAKELSSILKRLDGRERLMSMAFNKLAGSRFTDQTRETQISQIKAFFKGRSPYMTDDLTPDQRAMEADAAGLFMAIKNNNASGIERHIAAKRQFAERFYQEGVMETMMELSKPFENEAYTAGRRTNMPQERRASGAVAWFTDQWTAKNRPHIDALGITPARVKEFQAQLERQQGVSPLYSMRGVQDEVVDTIGAVGKAARGFNPRAGGWLDNLLSTAEWAQTKTGKAVFKARMAWNDNRQKLFHEADARASDKERSLYQDLLAIRNRGIGFIGRMSNTEMQDVQGAGNVSPVYKEVARVIRDMDVNEIKWSRYDKAGLDPEVISIVSDYRAAMDRLWEYQYNAIGDIVKAYAEKGKDLPELYRDPVTKQAVTLKDLYEEMGKLKGTYAPRIWDDGDFEVWSKDASGQLWLHKATTQAGAYKIGRGLERKGHTGIEYRESEKFSEELWADLSIGPTAKLLESAAGKMDVDPELSAEAKKALLEEAAIAFKERAFRKHRLARSQRGGREVRGYIEDPLARYLIYATRTAGGIAKSNAALGMFKALNGEYQKFERDGDLWVYKAPDGTRHVRRLSEKEKRSSKTTASFRVGGLDPKNPMDRAEYDKWYRYIKEQMKNPGQVDRVIAMGKAIVSMKYLSSPKSAIINTTSVLTNAPAAIRQYATGAKAGFVDVGNALARAGKDYVRIMRGGKLADKREQAFMDRIRNETIDRPQFMRDAMGAIRTAQGTAFAKTMELFLKPFSITEQWNRGATLLAAYRMATKHHPGLSEAELQEKAIDATLKAHGIYDRATDPMWAMGDNPAAHIAKMGYTYQKYGHNWMQMMFDLGFRKKDVKGALWLAAAPMLLGGTTGSIAMLGVMPLVAAFLKADGDDRDPEKWLYDTLREFVGADGEKVVRYGAFGALGMDMSGSLGLHIGAPRSLKDLTGPFGGVWGDIETAVDYLRSEQYGRAAEVLAPNLIRNVMSAVRELDGAVTANGRRVWDEKGRPYVPDGYETLLKALGARSANRALIQSREWERRVENERFKNQRDIIYDMLRADVVRPDSRKRGEIFKRIEKYNRFLIENGLAGEIPFITRQAIASQYKAMSRPKN